MKSEKFAIALVFGLALHQFALGQTNTAVTNQLTDAATSAAMSNEPAETMSAMSNALAAVTNQPTDAAASAAESNQPALPKRISRPMPWPRPAIKCRARQKQIWQGQIRPPG
jgi:hypothetical protein